MVQQNNVVMKVWEFLRTSFWERMVCFKRWEVDELERTQGWRPRTGTCMHLTQMKIIWPCYVYKRLHGPSLMICMSREHAWIWPQIWHHTSSKFKGDALEALVWEEQNTGCHRASGISKLQQAQRAQVTRGRLLQSWHACLEEFIWNALMSHSTQLWITQFALCVYNEFNMPFVCTVQYTLTIMKRK